jgi:hypothetical protein
LFIDNQVIKAEIVSAVKDSRHGSVEVVQVRRSQPWLPWSDCDSRVEIAGGKLFVQCLLSV